MQVVRKEPFVLIVPDSIVGNDPLHLLNTQPHVRYAPRLVWRSIGQPLLARATARCTGGTGVG